MTQRGRLLLISTVTAALILLTLRRLSGPGPANADAPAHHFSAARALAFMGNVLENAPHPIGSASHDRVRDRISAAMRSMGYAVDVQHTFACNASPVCGTVDNIIARMPGQLATSDSVIVAAHYDSVAAGPGASDDGAGVATLLEVARAIRDESFANPVVFLIDDGEESGLLGAEGFLADSNRSQDAAFVINVEARGTSGTSFLFETSRENRWLLPIVAGSLPHPVTTSLFATIYDRLPNDTDLTVFKRDGRAGLNFAYLGDGSQYHTPLDSAAHVNARSVQHRGDQVLAMVRAFGKANLRTPRNGDAVWFDVFGFFIAWWPASWTIWLCVLAAALAFVASILRIREGDATTSGVLLSFGSFVVSLPLAFGIGLVLASLLRLGGASALFPPHPLPMIASMWLTGAGVSFALTAFARKRISFDAAFLGHTLAWNAIAMVLAVKLPGASYVAVLPAIVMSACAIFRTIADVPEESVSVVSFLAAATVFFPVALVLHDALGPSSFPVIGLLVAMTATTVSPMLNRSAQPAVMVTFAAALLCAIIGCFMPRHSATHPVHLSVSHVTDADTGVAQWRTASLTDRVQKAAQFGLEKKIVAPWYGGRGTAFVAPAVPVTSAPPAVHVNSMSHDGLRTVTLEVASSRQEALLTIAWQSNLPPASMRINGVTPPPRPPRFHSSLAPQWTRVVVRGTSARLEIVTRGSSPAEAVISEATPGLPSSSARLMQARKASDAVPVHEGDQTIIVRRLRW